MPVAVHLDAVHIAALFHQVVIHGTDNIQVDVFAVHDFFYQHVSGASRTDNQHIAPLIFLPGHFHAHHADDTVKIPPEYGKQQKKQPVKHIKAARHRIRRIAPVKDMHINRQQDVVDKAGTADIHQLCRARIRPEAGIQPEYCKTDNGNRRRRPHNLHAFIQIVIRNPFQMQVKPGHQGEQAGKHYGTYIITYEEKSPYP